MTDSGRSKKNDNKFESCLFTVVEVYEGNFLSWLVLSSVCSSICVSSIQVFLNLRVLRCCVVSGL